MFTRSAKRKQEQEIEEEREEERVGKKRKRTEVEPGKKKFKDVIERPELSKIIKDYVPEDYINILTNTKTKEINNDTLLLVEINDKNNLLYLKATAFCSLYRNVTKYEIKEYQEFKNKVYVYLYSNIRRSPFVIEDFNNPTLKDEINNN